MEQVPFEVLDDPPDNIASIAETRARIGRWLILDFMQSSLGFTESQKIQISRLEVKDRSRFITSVRKIIDQIGKHPEPGLEAELEIAGVILEVLDDVYYGELARS